MKLKRIYDRARRLPRLGILSILGILCFLWYLFVRFPEEGVLDPTYGVLNKTPPNPHLAIATFLCADTDVDNDFYFTAARILTYQILHDEVTRSNRSIPFLVLVTQEVSKIRQDRLTQDGATVIEVPRVPLQGWIKTGVTRWKDQFTKLRLLEMVEYDRILFMDADTTLTRPIDAIFDEIIVRIPATTLQSRKAHIRKDEDSLPANYVLAARSNNEFSGQRDHPFPPPSTNQFSAGFWVVAPSLEMYSYLLSVMKHRRRFNPTTMEQSLLNYAFRREGAMPWMELDFRWSATWPNMGDFEGGVASFHEKLEWEGPDQLRKLWEMYRRRMEAYSNETNKETT